MDGPAIPPLRGTTVLDVSRMLPGAVLARIFADLGARVIKVEEPTVGDPMRRAWPRVGGVSAAFCAFYRGTESIGLNLKRPRDAATLLELARHADVVVESFRPGTLEAWGAGPETMLSNHPGLVVCSLTGFGAHGTGAASIGHDLNIVASSGLLSLLPGEGVPRTQLADVAAGMLACSAVLAALLGRVKTGLGGWIDQPLVGGTLPFMTLAMTDAAAGGGGLLDRLLGGECPAYRLYDCGDGLRLAVGALEPKFWAGFTGLLGLPELSDRGLDTGSAGQEAALQVQQKLATRPREHWLALARQRGLPVTPVHDPQAAAEDLGAAGFMEQTPVPGGGTLALPGPYLTSLGRTPSRPAPRLAEHTDAILAEFGLADASE